MMHPRSLWFDSSFTGFSLLSWICVLIMNSREDSSQLLTSAHEVVLICINNIESMGLDVEDLARGSTHETFDKCGLDFYRTSLHNSRAFRCIHEVAYFATVTSKLSSH